MTEGMVTDGWNFVWAAYGISWTALLLYTGSLVWRNRE